MKNHPIVKVAMPLLISLAVVAALLTGTSTARAQAATSCTTHEPTDSQTPGPDNDTAQTATAMGALPTGNQPGEMWDITQTHPTWGIDATNNDVDWFQFTVAPLAYGQVDPQILADIEVVPDGPDGTMHTEIWVDGQANTNLQDPFIAAVGTTVLVKVSATANLNSSTCYSLRIRTKVNPKKDITEVPNSWTPTWNLQFGPEGDLQCDSGTLQSGHCTGSRTWTTKIPLSLTISDDRDQYDLRIPRFRFQLPAESGLQHFDCTQHFARNTSQPNAPITLYTSEGRLSFVIKGAVNSRSTAAAELSNMDVNGVVTMNPDGGFSPEETYFSGGEITHTIDCPISNNVGELQLWDVGDWDEEHFNIGGYNLEITYELGWFSDPLDL